jgi:hypothetical protein
LGGDGVLGDTTKFIIWNSINDVNVQLANPQGECCNFLKELAGVMGGASPQQTVLVNNAEGDDNTLLPPARNGNVESFQFFPSAATCPNIGASLLGQQLTLTDSTANAAECTVQGFIFHGRSTSFTSAAIPPCTAAVTTNVIASLSDSNLVGPFSPSSNVILGITEFRIAMCDCAAPPSPCTPSLTCNEQNQVDLLSAAIAASTASINTNVDAVDVNVINGINRINSVQSSVNALSASTGNDAGDILDEVDNVRADVKKIRKDIGDLEDEVKDLKK